MKRRTRNDSATCTAITPLSVPLILTSDQEIRKNNVYFFLFTTYDRTGCSTNEEFPDARALSYKAAGDANLPSLALCKPAKKSWGSGRAQNKYRDCLFSMQ